MEYRKYYKPLHIIIIYLVFTLVLYEFGPFQWITYKPVLFWGLNIMFILSFIVGWKAGVHGSISKATFDTIEGKSILPVLRYSITINFIYEFINSLRRFKVTSFSLTELISRIRFGVSNMGDAYRDFQSGIDDVNIIAYGGRVVTVFNLIWAFATFNILILGIIYYKKLSIYNKMILVTTLILIVFNNIATGTNIGVFRIVLIFLVLFAIRVARGEAKTQVYSKKKNKRKLIILVVVALILVVVLFDKIMQSRGGILMWESSAYNIGGIRVNRDSFLFRILPKSMYMILVALSGYLSQGYYGMSLSLSIPWKPCYGVGHSMAILNLFGDYLKSAHENTYQYRLTEYGWREGIQWHTIYSWFANDFSYFGVILIVMLIGFLFSKAYRDAVETNNPYAKLVTYYFSLLAFFIPCNNQLFQTTYIQFSFITAIILWLCTRGKKRIVISFRSLLDTRP